MPLLLGVFECELRVIALPIQSTTAAEKRSPWRVDFFFCLDFSSFDQTGWMDDSHGKRTFGAQNKCRIWRSVSGRSETWLIFANFFATKEVHIGSGFASVRNRAQNFSVLDLDFFFENLVVFQPRAICSRPLDTP